MSRTLSFISIALALWAGPTQAQQLNDPMRPANFAGVEHTEMRPALQSIVIGKTHRYAIIDGLRLAPGEMYGDARLVRIAENEVTLRNGDGNMVLKLFPDIKADIKKIAAPQAGRRDIAQGE